MTETAITVDQQELAAKLAGTFGMDEKTTDFYFRRLKAEGLLPKGRGGVGGSPAPLTLKHAAIALLAFLSSPTAVGAPDIVSRIAALSCITGRPGAGFYPELPDNPLTELVKQTYQADIDAFLQRAGFAQEAAFLPALETFIKAWWESGDITFLPHISVGFGREHCQATLYLMVPVDNGTEYAVTVKYGHNGAEGWTRAGTLTRDGVAKIMGPFRDIPANPEADATNGGEHA